MKWWCRLSVTHATLAAGHGRVSRPANALFGLGRGRERTHVFGAPLPLVARTWVWYLSVRFGTAVRQSQQTAQSW